MAFTFLPVVWSGVKANADNEANANLIALEGDMADYVEFGDHWHFENAFTEIEITSSRYFWFLRPGKMIVKYSLRPDYVI